MSDYYKQPVAVFGLVLPIMIVLVLAGAVLFYTASVKDTYALKKQKYEQSQAAMRKVKMLRAQVEQNKASLDAWDRMLSTETRGTFLDHWKNAARNFTGKELTKSSRSWNNYSEGLGRGVSQASSQVVMSFVGTFKAMQTALMRLETTLPTMQLDSMDIKLDDNGKGVHFTTTYTVWTLR
jgi:hypothetical protein